VTDAASRLQGILAGRYVLERELGTGGMATVYLARDEMKDRPVAIKVLHPELAASLGGDRFIREIDLAGKLHHPNIMGIYDSGEADGLLYYVMPYVQGESLRDRLERERQLPVELTITITRQVAEALTHAHQEGVVHRDIKPENILLEHASGNAIVADFGVAHAVSAAGGEKLTKTGMAVGTPIYMSPEQARQDGVDERSDVYCLGATLFHALTLRLPTWSDAGERFWAMKRAGEIAARTIRRLGTSSSECRAMIAIGVGPVKGGWPISISYTTQASEYWSLRPSMRLSPSACSGDM